MHPRQANLIQGATKAVKATASKEAAMPILWKYTTPDGESFYLETRHMTIRSPWTGKTFTTRPVRMNPAQVGQAMKEDMRAPAVEPAMMMASDDNWKA